MKNHPWEWLNIRETVVDTIRRAHLVVVDANEVRLTSIEYRYRAAALREEAEGLRAASSSTRTSRLHGIEPP